MVTLKRLFPLVLLILSSFSIHAQEVAKVWVERDTINVGSVDKSVRTITIGFTIYNCGDAPLKISSIDSDCLCTKSDYDRVAISSGGTKKVTVSIDINPYFCGEMEKNIFILSNATEPKKTVTFVLNVVN